jgi:hypothetical protein
MIGNFFRHFEITAGYIKEWIPIANFLGALRKYYGSLNTASLGNHVLDSKFYSKLSTFLI